MISLLFVLSIVSFLVIQVSILDLGGVSLSNNYYQGSLLLVKTEGYLENAAIKFLRNPNYTGETLQEEKISCTIQIGDLGGQKDITATCQEGQFQKTAGMTVSVDKGVYNFSKIQER